MVDASASLTNLTRVGFAARGLLYIVIAYLLIAMGRAESPNGALEHVAKEGGGLLLTAIIAGFVAYGIWRMADALFNIEGHEGGNRGLRERLGAGGSGVVHLLLAWQAARLMQGDSSSGGGSQESASQTLSMPGGELMLILAGVLLMGIGVFQLIKAYKCSYLRHLEPRVASEPWAKWLGRVGYSARGLIFMISGFFLVRAGLHERASEAGGIEEALAWLSSPWDLMVAAGLFGFGLYSLVEARYRVLHRVPTTVRALRY